MNASLSVFQLILLILLVLSNLSPIRLSSLSYTTDGLTRNDTLIHDRTALPLTPKLRFERGTGDLCIDIVEQRAIVSLCDAEVTVALWQTPPEWQVEQAFFSDLNMDLEQEIALLVWRPFEPWPVDRFMPSGGRIDSFHDKNNRSCHLILVSLDEEDFRELWAGSALAAPIHSLVAADLDGDSRQELAAVEYSYDDNKRVGSLVVWRWSGFGFSLEARQAGSYSSLLALKTGKNVTLLAQ